MEKLVDLRVHRTKAVLRGITRSQAMALITDTAERENCGTYRHWQMDNIEYFDCGPITFTVEEIF